MDKNGQVTGYVFLKRLEIGSGFLEGVTKEIGGKEELFHFLYKNKKNGEKRIEKERPKGAILINKIDDES